MICGPGVARPSIESSAMIPMRRCTSAGVMDATPRAAGRCRCAVASPGSTASSSARRYRIVESLEVGEAKANAPDRGGLRSGALALRYRSRLAPLEFGLSAWLLFRGLTLWLAPRLSARRGSLTPRLTVRWRGLAPRLGARWRWLSAPPLFRHRSALRLSRRPLGPRGLFGARRLFGPLGAIRALRPLAAIGLIGPVRLVGLVPMVALFRLATAAILIDRLVFRRRATPGRLNVGR